MRLQPTTADAQDAQLDPWAAAAELSVMGVPVFPCQPNKAPYTARGFHDATTDVDALQAWSEKYPHALIGVPTGHISDLVVVDIDPDGLQWYAEHSADLACGRVHHTRRGYHLLYRAGTHSIRNSAGRLAPGVDVRGEGGYIIWWQAHGLEAIGDISEITEPPPWLLASIAARSNGPQKGQFETVQASRPGNVRSLALQDPNGPITAGRNDFLSRKAFGLRKQGLDVDQLSPVLHALNEKRCVPPLEAQEVQHIADGKAKIEPDSVGTVTTDDFFAYMPMHQYIFTPSRELWPASSVNARIPPIGSADGKAIKASDWLDHHQPVDQMTWAPGSPMLIRDRLVSSGGWIDRPGCAVFNLYREPQVGEGDPMQADRWVGHVHRIFGSDAEHVIRWLAHRVQHPGVKINHALVMGGGQGIGKDTLLEPAKYAVGPWNFSEVAPSHLLGRFNSFVKSVILRVSEARDLGDVDRYAFYDHMKTYTAAPPDVLRCDEKNIREYAVMNVCGVIITTNHKTDGIYLPADDRRHYVVWSDLTKDDFPANYWNDLWSWYAEGGIEHVAAYLATLDLSTFDPKAPPPKTAAFWDIVDASRAPEDAELADALDTMNHPDALTLANVAVHATPVFREWLQDRRNRRQIPHRLDAVGYVAVRSETAADGLWKVEGKRQAIYAKRSLAARDRIVAATAIGRSW